jgi:prepilin-type N-terminal cleavage/methylation domain-containing protein
MNDRSNDGFTLVELLLVIAIIGILAAVLYSVVTSQRERARASAFMQQMKTISVGMSSCLDEGGTLQEPGDNLDRRICSTGLAHGAYLPDAEMINCINVGSYTVSVVGDTLVGVCNLSGGLNCNAVCDYNGCSFSAACD